LKSQKKLKVQPEAAALKRGQLEVSDPQYGKNNNKNS